MDSAEMFDGREDQSFFKEELKDDIAPPPTPKITPKKRGPAKAKDEESPSKKAKGAIDGKLIPNNESELMELDRVLIQMREGGSSWIQIAAEWEEKTGKKVWDSTVRKRYTKLKASLARVKDEDMDMMKSTAEQVKAEVEAEKKKLDAGLWARISAIMAEAGTEKYEPGTIEKACKNMGANGGRSSSMTVVAEKEEDV
ncbi:Peptidyl-prolyl cis-trans isomerase-like 4 [Venturia nashicola]|nr:Peptidyl-prolyl cis-trans isomerase-like 4 [Venturia nashicola]